MVTLYMNPLNGVTSFNFSGHSVVSKYFIRDMFPFPGNFKYESSLFKSDAAAISITDILIQGSHLCLPSFCHCCSRPPQFRQQLLRLLLLHA